MQQGANFAPHIPAPVFNQLTHNGLTNVAGGIAKPILVNPFQNAIETGRAITAEATNNVPALQASQAREAQNVKESLPYQVAAPFGRIAKGLAYTPQAIGREIQNKPITDIQQKAFGTSDSGQIAKNIAANVLSAGLTVAAPDVGKIANTFSAPLADAVSSPVAQRLITGGIRGLAEAPLGAATNVANLYGSNPGATNQQALQAGLQGAAAAGLLSATPEIAGATKDLATKAINPRPANISNSEVAAIAKMREISGTGASMGQDAVFSTARKALTKVGINPTDTTAVDNLLGQFRTFNTRSQQRQQAIQTAKDRLAVSNQVGGGGGKSIPDRISEQENIYMQNHTKPGDITKLQQVAGGMSDRKYLSTLEGLNKTDSILLGKNVNEPAIPAPKGMIIKETKPLPDGSKIVVRARVNPETGKMESYQERVNKNSDLAQAAGTQDTSQEISKIGSSVSPTNRLDSRATSREQLQPQTLSSPDTTAYAKSPSSKRNIDAERSVINDFQNGKTHDEIVYSYMKQTGTDLQTAVHDVARVAHEAQIAGGDGTNPLRGTVDIPQAHDAGQAHLNAENVHQQLETARSHASTMVQSLSGHDISLLRDIETKPVSEVAKSAENVAGFKQTVEGLRQYYDLRDAWDNRLGIDHNYRFNYLRQLVEPKPGEPSIAKGVSKRPGYTKQRSYETLKTDVMSALDREKGATFNLAKSAYSEGLQHLYGNKVANGELLRGENGIYKTLQTKYGSGITASPEIANELNKRGLAPEAGNFGKRYDNANALFKYIKLSGGAFHAVTEAGNFIGQQIASGKIVTNPRATGQLFHAFFSPEFVRSETTRLADSGTLRNADLAGLKRFATDIKADVSTTPKSVLSKYTGIKALHDATFQREIPFAKLKIFEQRTQGLDPNVPADLAQMRVVAERLNNGFGGIDRNIQGINQRGFKWLQRGLLATDFTEGKINTLLTAISKGGEEGKLARQIVGGKMVLFAALATGGGALAGEYKDKNAKQIAGNALVNLFDPTFQVGNKSVGFPATHVSEFGSVVRPFLDSKYKDKFSGVKNYATNRLAAIPSEVNQLVNNKDASGKQIYSGYDKFGHKVDVPAGKTVANVASGFVPIPAAQGIGVAEGKTSPGEAALNTLGLRVKNVTQPTPTSSSAANGVAPGNRYTPQAKADTTAELNSLKSKAGEGYSLQQLPNGKYAYNINGEIKTSDNLKSAQQAIVKDSFSNSNQNIKIVGDNVLRKSADGTVSVTPKYKYDYQVGTATLVQQKKADNLTGYIATAKKQLDNISQQLKDPNIDPLDALSLNNDAQTLQDNISKYTSYGGFTKGKSVAAKTKKDLTKLSSVVKAAAAIKPPKSPSAPKSTLKQPTFKTATVKSYKVAKTPKIVTSRKKTALA